MAGKKKQQKKQKKKQTPHGAYGPGGASSGYQDMLKEAYYRGNSPDKTSRDD